MWAKPKMTPEKVKELEWYFMLGLTDEESCFLADISRETLNKYCQANEKWREKKELLKRKPIIQAKKNMVEKINWQDYDATKWYLERKAKDEFSTKVENENTNTNLNVTDDVSEEQKKLIAKRYNGSN